jgi:pilus assembly protein CpaD
MNHFAHVLRGCAALAAVLVAACAYPINGPEDEGRVEERFPIAVAPHMEALRLPYDAARADIDQAGSAELQRFARDYLDAGSGTIGIVAPRRAPELAGNIADRLVALGIPRNRIMIGGETALATDEVRITYIRYTAQAPTCGDWSASLTYTSANHPAANWGCATRHNLAVMVADPRDLAKPTPLDPGDAQRRLTILDKYRKGEVTLADKEKEQSGEVSNIKTGSGGGM